MGPLKVVHIPRLQRLMRGVDEPYLRRPLIEQVDPRVTPTITPWWQQGMGALDLEYGASMQPRSNPAFSDAWLVGATGGASRVVPQGIDYSRTPCCASTGLSGGDALMLGVGAIGVPLVLLGSVVAMDWLGKLAAGGRPRRTWR